MQTYLWITFWNGLIATGILLAGFWVFKVFVFGKDFRHVLQEKGVSGGSIVLGAFLLGLAIVVAAASV